MPGLQACALKSPEQIRALIYGWAVGTVGAGDTVAFGLPGTLLRMAGVYVPVCSQDYQTGQGIGGLVNGALALASLGGDATADASLAGEAAGAGERFVADGAATEGEGLLPSAEGDATGGAGDPGGNPSGCNCFPGNTGVATPHGLVAIAAIKVGDTVLAEDPSTHRVDAEPVQAVIDDGVKPLLRLQLSDGSGLKVTANHPFYVDGGPGIVTPRWVQAGDLRVGDRLRTADGKDVTVTALRYHIGFAHVYTLTVAHDHTFWGESRRDPASTGAPHFHRRWWAAGPSRSSWVQRACWCIMRMRPSAAEVWQMARLRP